MESCALTLSSSTLNPKALNHINRNTIHKITTVYHSCSSPGSLNYKTTNSKHSVPSFPSYNSSLFSPKRFHYDFALVRAAAAAPDASGESANPAKISRTLQLAAMFGVWYLLNIYFNIFNKQVAFPLTVLALAVAHTMGNLLTNVSLGKVAVSFTHTIKAMEPFFTVLFSVLLLSERPSMWVVSSLVPIVGGVALASFTEASFNWIGFASAMASNVTNQSRNVLSKMFMVRKEEALDNINLFSVMTIVSFFLLIPFAYLLEGFKLTPEYLQFAASQGINVRDLCVRFVLTGICFHSYQQVSYMILGMVSPVTHAVGNCVKRVVVIVSSVIFFRTPVSPINALGTGLALAGVFLYSKAKRIKPKAA